MAKDDVELVGPAGYVMMPKARERTLLASGHYQTPADFLSAQTKANAEMAGAAPKAVEAPAEGSDPIEPEEE